MLTTSLEGGVEQAENIANQQQTRLWASISLLKSVKEEYPEARRLTFTGDIDWALRRLLEEAKQVKRGD